MPPQSPPPSGTRPLSPTAPYSSPSSPTSIGSRRNMEKRIPSVTPRRFRRFFTPRSFVSRQSRTALRIMGSAAVNSLPPTPPSPASPASDPPIPSSPTQNHLSVINRQDKRKRNKHQDNTTKRRRGLLPGPSPLTPPRIRHEGFASQELARPLVQPQTEPRTDLLALTEGREATLVRMKPPLFFPNSKLPPPFQLGLLLNCHFSAARVNSSKPAVRPSRAHSTKRLIRETKPWTPMPVVPS